MGLVIFFIIFAYLLGSICSAILVCKALKLPDPRTEGSKNPGATNVLRIGGKNAAILTLIGDMLKGFIPVFCAQLFGIEGFSLGLIALAAFLGHLYPIFFQFKGGKGVATAFGAVLGLSFLVGFLLAITWLVVAFISRYSSLAALVTAALGPIYLLIFSNKAYFFPTLAMTALIFWRHRDNIEKLRGGQEDKINTGKSDEI
jgi:glycerol-3-phosphate acyltransferase PlsY